MIYRKATFNDVEEIYNLVNLYAQEGVMLARSRNTLYETLRDMYVAEEDGEILGVGGLHDHVELLREYLVQIRELYQSLIDVQQNKVMSILTVVTTIFLPLTLIAGWYGMNFPNMPEFRWKYAYPVVIIASIFIIAGEIVYFKKKKML